MKIGNGSSRFGMLGLSHNGELTISKLEGLAKATLDFYPLGNILHISDIKISHISPKINSEITFANSSDLKPLFSNYPREMEEKISKFKEGGNFEIVGVIKKDGKCIYKNGIVHADTRPAVIAHEIGHALDLDHFNLPSCNKPWLTICLKKEFREKCSSSDYIMCGYGYMKSFSPGNIKKLEELYLK